MILIAINYSSTPFNSMHVSQIFIDGRHTVGIPRGTVVNANAFAVPEQPHIHLWFKFS